MASLTTGGISYAFGLYGDALKKTLHLSQGQLDTISTAFFFAGLFSWIPGLCADRYGTRFALSIGGVATGTSTLSFWAVARQFIPVPHSMLVVTLSILGISIFLSSALITGSVFKIIVASCGPGTKGSAVGVAKGYVGLGAGVYASLFEAIRVPNETDLDFLPMAAFFAIVCGTLPALALLPTPEQVERTTLVDEATPLHFRTLYGSLACMAVLIIINSMSELRESSLSSSAQRAGPNYAMSLFLMCIWLAPILSLLYLPRKQQIVSNGVVVMASDDYRDEPDEDDEEEVIIPDDDDELSGDGEQDPLQATGKKQLDEPHLTQ